MQEKVEGLAVAANGNLSVLTDNDGLDDGETVDLHLGRAGEVLQG